MPQHLIGRPMSALREFLRLESASGLILIGTTVLALAVANSPARDTYTDFLSIKLGFPGLALSVLHGSMMVLRGVTSSRGDPSVDRGGPVAPAFRHICSALAFGGLIDAARWRDGRAVGGADNALETASATRIGWLGPA
jgi:hypothetical protein